MFQRCAAYLLVTLTVLPFTAPLAICPLTDLLAAAKSVRLLSRTSAAADLHRTTLAVGPSGALATARQDSDVTALAHASVPHLTGNDQRAREAGAQGGPRRSVPPLIPLRI